MALVIISFCAVFLLIGSGAVMMFYREPLLQRISEAINPHQGKKKKSMAATIRESGFSIGAVVGNLERFLPKSQTEKSIVLQRLGRAGYRNESAARIFYGYKVFVPLALCALAFITNVASVSEFFVYASCLGIGFLGPDFWLGWRISARQKRIVRGLPDVLDLLVICIEAGLSLDQATSRTAQELKGAQPELCDEFGILVLEQRAGRARSEAWKNLADRTGVDSLRNLVSVLVQSEQFGTSVAKTLRQHADTLRTQRMQAVEEMAAKTSVKLVFPLVFFIFPALFLVTLGPAVILMMESFKTFFNS
jgi:tight adherence protein C